MQPLKAHVRSGRLVLDDPTTELPEGSEVELIVVQGDELDPQERARLIEAIEESEEDIAAGKYVDGMAFANDLLAKREALSR